MVRNSLRAAHTCLCEAEAQRTRANCGSVSKLTLFERFKMLLLKGTPNEKTLVNDSRGRPFPLLRVVAELLSFVKREALKELSNAMPHPVTAAQVRWVITVPAVWSDEAKGFMRLAALHAGCGARGPRPSAVCMHVREADALHAPA